MKPLFIPLKTEYYRSFENGTKTHEYRRYSNRWDEVSCRIGRLVVLALGYSGPGRLRGKVSSFRQLRYSDLSCANQAAWLQCYGAEDVTVAEIGIELELL